MMEFFVQYPYLLVPLIFFARVADVSLATFRTIVIFRGRKLLASVIGFIEIIIWLVAASQVLTNLDQWYLALAYASGFAVGNYVGISIESRFAIGNELIRCISFNRDMLAGELRKEGFKVVSFDGDMGETHPVELLLIIEKRRNVPSLVRLIRTLDETAVYSVSDVKSVYEGPELLHRRSFSGNTSMPARKH
ncbi:DUF2179 domain-containing protein [Pontiellaceae bacterium B12227]|nr:DUF2179 domain-containing protein [Pontiellaceae bacterium B12227]